jgi:hypothetical protein
MTKTEFKVTVRGNDGYLFGIWYFPTQAEADRWAAIMERKGWNPWNITIEEV